MKTIAELKRDKIVLRATDPLRASICETIVDTAFKMAKSENREVADSDIVPAIKKQIKQNEGAIELIKANNGNASKWEAELAMLREYLPVQMTEDETRTKVMEALATIPEAERTKKAIGRIIGMMKQFDNIDMKEVSKILAKELS